MHICVIVDYAPHGVRIVQTMAQCTISAWTRVPFKLCLCAQCSKHFTAVNSKFNSNNIYSITLAGERVVCQCNFTVFLRQIFWCHNCFFFKKGVHISRSSVHVTTISLNEEYSTIPYQTPRNWHILSSLYNKLCHSTSVSWKRLSAIICRNRRTWV